jgi:hypothetical protein
MAEVAGQHALEPDEELGEQRLVETRATCGSCAMSSSVALLPAMTAAGSPGSAAGSGTRRSDDHQHRNHGQHAAKRKLEHGGSFACRC